MPRNIRLTLAYDGSNYAGWQVQPDQPTLQVAVEDAIFRLTGERVSLLSAGRTDAGVHALGQVANFLTEATIPPEKWRPALQSKLPNDIVIGDSDEVPLDFHATYAAKSKRYRYVILNSLLDDPFLRRYVWRIGTPLNVEAMDSAARLLIGTHDFRSFESHWPNTGSSVRTMTDARVFRVEAWPLFEAFSADAGRSRAEGETARPFVCFEIAGDGFLYNMVRAIVGTLVNVGRGTWTESEFEAVLKAQNRDDAGDTAPPQGLYLVAVEYPPLASIGNSRLASEPAKPGPVPDISVP